MNIRVLTATALVLAACASEPASKLSPPAAAPEPTTSAVSAEPAKKSAAPAAATPTEATAQAPAAVTRVEPELVCMVNNHYMGKAQIPVVVEGKTYFGCCEMCKSKLAQDPQSRAAVDPVSGATVDKAIAVIGREASGTVVYFENEKNLERYASR